jgi:hypothetical protein
MQAARVCPWRIAPATDTFFTLRLCSPRTGDSSVMHALVAVQVSFMGQCMSKNMLQAPATY